VVDHHDAGTDAPRVGDLLPSEVILERLAVVFPGGHWRAERGVDLGPILEFR
jgi:hypothetical protein